MKLYSPVAKLWVASEARAITKAQTETPTTGQTIPDYTMTIIAVIAAVVVAVAVAVLILKKR